MSVAKPGAVVTLLRGKTYYSHNIKFIAGEPQVVTDDAVLEDLADDMDIVRTVSGEIMSVPRFSVTYYHDVSEEEIKLRARAAATQPKQKSTRLAQLKAEANKRQGKPAQKGEAVSTSDGDAPAAPIPAKGPRLTPRSQA